jgi:hypothetical protein
MSSRCCQRRYFRLPRAQIAYVRFIVESYEGLAQVTSIPTRGEMAWIVPDSQAALADALAASLAEEIPFIEISRPENWPEDPW